MKLWKNGGSLLAVAVGCVMAVAGTGCLGGATAGEPEMIAVACDTDIGGGRTFAVAKFEGYSAAELAVRVKPIQADGPTTMPDDDYQVESLPFSVRDGRASVACPPGRTILFFLR